MLNSEQKKAVRYNSGPLLIIAGAGTGKTTVIVEKIKYLIDKKKARPDEILALTFTEKAAYEMEERVDEAMPYGYFQMWISTFHAFADQILKENAPEIGWTPGFRIMTEAETLIFMKKNLFLFQLDYYRPLGNPNKFLSAIINHFSRLRDENISADDYLDWASKIDTNKRESQSFEQAEIDKYKELAHAYEIYQTLKIKEGLMDYADLIFYLVKLFQRRKSILREYQKKFRYVLVDEFQDTNIAQYELIKLLCPPSSNPKLTLVGDDSQAIYKFRGASVSNILNFRQDYKKSRQISLIRNYRSNQSILDSSYELIRHNDPDTLEYQLHISKKLRSAIPNKGVGDDQIKVFIADHVEEEADFVVSEIKKLSRKYKFSDFAVLGRANSHAEPFIRAFIRHGIPYQFLGPGMLLKQPEVKDLIAYLKTLNNLDDSVSFFRVLNMEIFEINKVDVNLLSAFAKKTNTSLFQATKIFLGFFYKDLLCPDDEVYKKHLPLLMEKTRKSLFYIYTLIDKHLEKIRKDTAGQILYDFLESTGYLPKLTNYKTESEEKIALNVSSFFNKLKNYEVDHEDASVSSVVDFLDMSLELGESPAVSKTDLNLLNAVNIITVHSAKGLEFPVVFMINLTRGRFPTYNKPETLPIPNALVKESLPQGDYHEEEERRLFYVGMTRAKDRIFMTASRFYGEGKREQKISSFINEALGEGLTQRLVVKKKEEKQQLSIFDFKKVPENFVKTKYVNKNFSYTQLETYERCPLQYKYQYIMRVPTTPSASLSFGDTIHKTMQYFYNEFMKDKTVPLEKLLRIYKNSWIPLGYASADHEKRMKSEGIKILTGYFDKYHNRQIDILATEKPFKIKLYDQIFITGKIDRIDRGVGSTIEIVDYKTGKKPTDKDLKKSLQLSIYALAATNRGLYNKKLRDVNLVFYYLQTGDRISFKKTPEEISDTKTRIKTIVDEIKSSAYDPKVGPWCDFCPFKMICEAWQ